MDSACATLARHAGRLAQSSAAASSVRPASAQRSCSQCTVAAVTTAAHGSSFRALQRPGCLAAWVIPHVPSSLWEVSDTAHKCETDVFIKLSTWPRHIFWSAWF